MNEKFKLWLEKNEWQVELNSMKFDDMKNEVLNRYNYIPKSFISILEDYKCIASKDDTTWFICGDDYLDRSDDVFKWNEFEIMSLEAAEGDEVWKKEIKDWWSDKLPFIMSVKSGYSFYAIDLGDNKGAILMGQEPEFEEANVVARDFDDFLEKIFNNDIIL